MKMKKKSEKKRQVQTNVYKNKSITHKCKNRQLADSPLRNSPYTILAFSANLHLATILFLALDPKQLPIVSAVNEVMCSRASISAAVPSTTVVWKYV